MELTVGVGADANGFYWSTNDGNNVRTFPDLLTPVPTDGPSNEGYGNQNDQFARLSALWDSYRINSVELAIQPVGSGGQTNVAAIFSVIDEQGKLASRAGPGGVGIGPGS